MKRNCIFIINDNHNTFPIQKLTVRKYSLNMSYFVGVKQDFIIQNYS